MASMRPSLRRMRYVINVYGILGERNNIQHAIVMMMSKTDAKLRSSHKPRVEINSGLKVEIGSRNETRPLAEIYD